ncbi:signal peptidase I [Exiguobacterium sp. s163]|uniref:signal peptidase I n=1 Tax=Exiguobacterium sp. s163 TaxID=2751287 RepID=UPI001BEB8B1D|nr:signal peptidase I [Exiguobacterium sp. s163]
MKQNDEKLPELNANTENNERNGFLKGYLPYLLLGLMLAFAIRLIISPTVVVGESMEGSLHDGDYLIVNKLAYKVGEPEYGDVVILDADVVPGHEVYIKRIVGLPGDVLESKEGILYRDGKRVDEPYALETMESEDFKLVVPENEVFVLGDNRNNSADSRVFGTLDYKDEVIGKALIRLNPLDQGYKYEQ